MLRGLVKYEGIHQQLSNFNERLSDLNIIISDTVNNQNKVQYVRTNNIRLT
jgi:hypothetical protein